MATIAKWIKEHNENCKIMFIGPCISKKAEIKDERVSFSRESFAEICRLTQGHYDNWEKPNKETKSIFSQYKSYKSPYLYDFNLGGLEEINNKRILS